MPHTTDASTWFPLRTYLVINDQVDKYYYATMTNSRGRKADMKLYCLPPSHPLAQIELVRIDLLEWKQNSGSKLMKL